MDQILRKHPWSFLAKNCKLISSKSFFQNLASTFSFWIMSSSYVTVQKNHTVQRVGRGAEQRQIWQIVLYCDRIRCYAAEMWQKLKCYACFILPKLIKNRLTDQWYWSRIGKVAAYLVKQQNSLKRIARKTWDVATWKTESVSEFKILHF